MQTNGLLNSPYSTLPKILLRNYFDKHNEQTTISYCLVFYTADYEQKVAPLYRTVGLCCPETSMTMISLTLVKCNEILYSISVLISLRKYGKSTQRPDHRPARVPKYVVGATKRIIPNPKKPHLEQTCKHMCVVFYAMCYALRISERRPKGGWKQHSENTKTKRKRLQDVGFRFSPVLFA